MTTRSFVALLLVASCARSAAPAERATPSWPLGHEPEALRTEVERANAAMTELQKTLQKRLMAELANGPSAAVKVCRDEAAKLTAEVSAARGVEVGRTSFRLRNPANAPRAWAAPFVAQGSGRAASEATPVVVDLGDRLGVLRPIPMAPPCLACHGPEAGISGEVKQVLLEAYPRDQATAFLEGQVRGFFWAEVKKP